MTAILELPGLWIDQVVLDDLDLIAAAPYFRVINRNPEPGQFQVRTDSTIVLELATDVGDSPAVATTQVFISINGGAEILVYDGGAGGFQAGYTGPLSTVTSPDANTLRIVIDPSSDFDSLQAVTVRVIATSTLALAIDESWDFTIEDVTAPVMVSAQPTSKTTILVTFDEPMDSVLLLTAANYAITRLTIPAVNVVVVSVESETDSTAILTLDIEMSPGAS